MNYGNWTNSNCNQSCDCQFIFKTWISSQTSDKELTQVTQEKKYRYHKGEPPFKRRYKQRLPNMWNYNSETN